MKSDHFSPVNPSLRRPQEHDTRRKVKTTMIHQTKDPEITSARNRGKTDREPQGEANENFKRKFEWDGKVNEPCPLRTFKHHPQGQKTNCRPSKHDQLQ